MDLVSNIVITLLGTVIGAVLPLVFPYLMRCYRNHNRSDLLGTWYSAYQQYQRQNCFDRWVNEKVVIDLHGSRFRLRNSGNSLDDGYEGFATLEEGELVGKWRSIRRHGGHAQGSLLLTVLPMGGLLHGFFTGPRDTGERVFGAWVLGKTEADVAKGKALITRQTLQRVGDSHRHATLDRTNHP